MSDRRRPPTQDDWDDDLDLAGWEQPPARRRESRPVPRGQSQPRPDPYAIEFEDAPADQYDPNRPATRRPRPSQDRYAADPDRYGQAPERRSSSSGQYRAPSSPPRGAPETPYGYDDYLDQPSRQSASTVPSQRQRYPAAPADFEAEPYVAPAPRRGRTRGQGAARPRPSVVVPRPAINDGTAIAIVAASLLSVVLMAASIAAGDLPDWFPIHLDASGDPDLWGTSDALWRIPFGVFIALIMSLVIAAFLWKRDRFAARTAIAGTALMQVLAWVALIDFVW